VCIHVSVDWGRAGRGGGGIFVWTDFAIAAEDNINITLVPVLLLEMPHP